MLKKKKLIIFLDLMNVIEWFKVEKIVDQRTIKGRRQFLVRWKGYTEEADTWEQEKELNCDRLIEEFLAEQEENESEKEEEKEKEKSSKKTKAKKQEKKSKLKKTSKTKNGMSRKKLFTGICTTN